MVAEESENKKKLQAFRTSYSINKAKKVGSRQGVHTGSKAVNKFVS